MKRALNISVILLLLVWNSILSYELFGRTPDNSTIINDGTTIVQQVFTEFSTDVTRVVANSVEKVVGISAFRRGSLFSTGSGAIFDYSLGLVHIITNNHVVEGADEIRVTFANGEEITVTLMGSDVYSDLALLEGTINFDVLPFRLGDSSLTKVGETVLAIGSPLGLSFQGSVTRGIISGKDRVVPVDLNRDGIADWDSIVLQTDAAINPGNSGGPLINLAGELIGITSMKIAASAVEGMGFAIPVNEVIPIITQLKENGRVIRPVIGISAVSLSELTTYQKSFYGIRLDLNRGLYVLAVSENSPAEIAGLREGDIIVRFDGVDITSFRDFRRQLYAKNVGDVVVIEYLRDGNNLSVELTLK
jgi:serine protease Do